MLWWRALPRGNRPRRQGYQLDCEVGYLVCFAVSIGRWSYYVTALGYDVNPFAPELGRIVEEVFDHLTCSGIRVGIIKVIMLSAGGGCDMQCVGLALGLDVFFELFDTIVLNIKINDQQMIS